MRNAKVSFYLHFGTLSDDHLFHCMNRERFEMEDRLGTAHEGPLVFCCLVDHLFHSFLPQKANFYELSHQFPEDGLAVDAVDE